MNRRDLLRATTAAGLAPVLAAARPGKRYDGPNVIIVRFGGGVRTQEALKRKDGYAPYLNLEFIPRGVAFPAMEIEPGPGHIGHGEGTLNILTGTYDDYKAGAEESAQGRFEPKVPTLFEALRSEYDVPDHRALLVNGEDRDARGIYSLGHRHLHGAWTRARVISPDRFRMFTLRRALEGGGLDGVRIAAAKERLAQMAKLDLRQPEPASAEIDRFWGAWADYYGDEGLASPRGDRLVAELAVQAMRKLRPHLMMVEFQDTDFAHSGIKSRYTRGVTAVDEGLRRIDEETRADPFYRDRTVVVVVPDCGRDVNDLVPCGFQHHSGSWASRRIFAAFAGPGVEGGRTVKRRVGQDAIAGTVARIMKFPMKAAAPPLGEVLA